MKASSSPVVPMKGAVLGSLLMAWAWTVIAGSVGLNALIKSNQQKSKLKKSVPPPTVIDVNTDDVFESGVVLTTVAVFIAVLCSIFILMIFFTRGLAARSFRVQSLVLAFCAIWLFATLVPFTAFFANRSAKVTATIGSIQLPPKAIQQAEQALGLSSIYNKIDYLRLVAILPWIALLFTIIASIVLFVAGSPARRTQAERGDSSSHDTRSDNGTVEKGAAPPATSAV